MGKKKAQAGSEGPTIENRKARHDYAILDTLEAGIMLVGSEVKSVRDGKVSLGEGYVRVEDSPPSMWLHSVNIAEYAPAGAHQHAPTRTRRLLAHKREITKLFRQVDAKGLTIVPLKMYFKNGLAKVLIGLAMGKSRADKRQSIARRESDRDIARAMSKRV